MHTIWQRKGDAMSREHGQGEGLEVVFRAQDEITANLIKGLLESEDIPVIIQSHMIPWLDGAMTAAEGHWGDIVVPKEYFERSLEIINEYMSSSAENTESD